MTQQFLVRVNLHALRHSLSKADGLVYNLTQVQQFLLDAGFRSRGSYWLVSESDLGHLHPSEVEEITPWTEVGASAELSGAAATPRAMFG